MFCLDTLDYAIEQQCLNHNAFGGAGMPGFIGRRAGAAA